VNIRLTRKFLREIAAKGGANSRKYMTRRQASALARKAIQARWAKARGGEAKVIDAKPIDTK
jgi:hypothetical protein